MLAACFVLNMFGRGLGDTYAVFLLPLEREFGWTRSQVTSVYSLYLLVNGCTAPLVGMLFDRLGARWVYGAGMAVPRRRLLLRRRAGQPVAVLSLIGALVGIGVSLNGMVPGSALARALVPRSACRRAIGIAFSAFGVGVIVFVPLAQFLVGDYDWRAAYRLMGGLLLLLAPIVVLACPGAASRPGIPSCAARPGARRRARGGRSRAALRTPVFWGLARCSSSRPTGMFAVVVQLVAFFIDAGFSPLTAATAFGMLGMLSAAASWLSGIAADRFGYRQIVTASFVGTAQRHGDAAADSAPIPRCSCWCSSSPCSACAWACAGRSCPRCRAKLFRRPARRHHLRQHLLDATRSARASAR